MNEQIQSDLARVKPEYSADAFLILQKGNIPLTPRSDYFKCLATLKYIIRMDEDNPMIQHITEKYDLNQKNI